ncbi:hypothetical protein AN1V17_03620 [Vallitalea sediminicola]
MKKNILGIIITLIGILFAIGVYSFSGALNEKPSNHPLDFQDIREMIIDKPINSINDGLIYANARADEWRNDSILTGIEIKSVGKKEIQEKTTEKIWYYYEFPYVDNSKPHGIIKITINTKKSSISYIDAVHDNDTKNTILLQLDLDNVSFDINEIYEIGINEIGIDTIFQYEEPVATLSINNDYAILKVSSSIKEQSDVKYQVKIDMDTGEVIKFKLKK